jgi:hypothetical protein
VSYSREVYASGANYKIEVVDDLVRWAVWSRPDLDSQQGARCAEEQVAHAIALAMGATQGMLFDVSGAPSVMGPRTQAAIVATMSPWERARKPVAVVISENALQRLQWERIVRETLSKSGRIFLVVPPALHWLSTVRAAAPRVIA